MEAFFVRYKTTHFRWEPTPFERLARNLRRVYIFAATESCREAQFRLVQKEPSHDFLIWFAVTPRNLLSRYPFLNVIAPNTFSKHYAFQLNDSKVYLFFLGIISLHTFAIQFRSECTVTFLIRVQLHTLCTLYEIHFFFLSRHKFFIKRLLWKWKIVLKREKW